MNDNPRINREALRNCLIGFGNATAFVPSNVDAAIDLLIAATPQEQPRHSVNIMPEHVIAIKEAMKNAPRNRRLILETLLPDEECQADNERLFNLREGIK